MSKTSDRNRWTLSHRVDVGQTFMAVCHRVRCLQIISRHDTHNLCLVEVLGPVPGSNGKINGVDNPIPPMMHSGEMYDTEGLFVEQPHA